VFRRDAARRDEFYASELFRPRNFPVPLDFREIAKRANKVALNPQWNLPDSLAVPARCGRSDFVKLTPRTVSERVYFESLDESHLETNVPPADLDNCVSRLFKLTAAIKIVRHRRRNCVPAVRGEHCLLTKLPLESASVTVSLFHTKHLFYGN